MNIEQRIERLERTNRSMKLACGVFVGIAGLGACLGAATRSSDQQAEVDKPPKLALAVKPIPSFDPRQNSDSTPDLEFKDKNGVVRMKLGILPDGNPIIMMRNIKGDRQLILWTDQLNAYAIDGGKEKKVASFQADTISVGDPEKKWTSYLGTGYIQLNRDNDNRLTSLYPGFLSLGRGTSFAQIGVTDQDSATVRLKDAKGDKDIVTK
jgi:hypothetical protein